MTKFITPVVLCGGSGTRLWPRSRATKPKPFLPLVGNSTLFEATLDRCSDQAQFAPPIVVAGEAHLNHVESQLGGQGEARVIVEPSARNTAAAIAMAALALPDDAIMLVCPSDHHIADVAAFRAAAGKAAELARSGWLVSFGIEAKSPETGFGYLERGDPIEDLGYRTARFVEKPDFARAQQFIDSGNFFWNGGIFAFEGGAFLAELETHRPRTAAAARRAYDKGIADGRRFRPGMDDFNQIENESVDYAVMENTDRAALVPADMGWSDIGSWDALHIARDCDGAGNSTRGNTELINCQNVLVDTDGPRVSVIGLQDAIVVVDNGEVLVTTRAGAQGVGKLNGAVNQ